eukprot:7196316-Prymnesium_polylepis.1
MRIACREGIEVSRPAFHPRTATRDSMECRGTTASIEFMPGSSSARKKSSRGGPALIEPVNESAGEGVDTQAATKSDEGIDLLCVQSPGIGASGEIVTLPSGKRRVCAGYGVADGVRATVLGDARDSSAGARWLPATSEKGKVDPVRVVEPVQARAQSHAVHAGRAGRHHAAQRVHLPLVCDDAGLPVQRGRDRDQAEAAE